VNIVEEEKKEK